MPISLKQIKKLPDSPGVYFFKKGKEILYIGKATSLRDRVRSYLAHELAETRGMRVAGLPFIATRVDYLTTGSVLEALLSEVELIKKHQPPFNTREKDDKSFLHIVITNEDYPRVLLMRGKDLKPNNLKPIPSTYGPFPSGSELKKALIIIRKIFPHRSTCVPFEALAKQGRVCRPCFNAQIGLCPGVCSGAISQKVYYRQILQLKLFLAGKKKSLYREHEREMKLFVKEEKFEEAKIIRDRLFSLKHIRDVALLTGHRVSNNLRLEAYDVAHLSGQNTVGVMAVIERGELIKSEYRKFKLKGGAKNISNDTANLREILTRRLAHHEWPMSKIIVVDGGMAQVNIAKKVLVKNKLNIAVIGVVKNEHHRPNKLIGDTKILNDDLAREILLANSEAHRFALAYHTLIRGKING